MREQRFFSCEESSRLDGGYLVTINLQHLYESSRNRELQRVIFHDANARYCIDGRGALIVFQRWLGRTLPLATGNEVLRQCLQEGAGKRVLVIGSMADVIAKVRQQYPEVHMDHDDSRIPALNRESAEAQARAIVARFGLRYDFVAIALGVPKQEILASALSRLMPKTPIYCIGGSFEMLAGHFRRAPVLMQRLGLEGVWRLLIQPRKDRVLRLVLSYWFFALFLLQPQRLAHITESLDK